MNKSKLLTATAIVTLAFVGTALAADPMVGGAAMYPSKNIIQNAMNSKDHTTLVAAVKAGGLVDITRRTWAVSPYSPRPTRRSQNYLPERWTIC